MDNQNQDDREFEPITGSDISPADTQGDCATSHMTILSEDYVSTSEKITSRRDLEIAGRLVKHHRLWPFFGKAFVSGIIAVFVWISKACE
jgi:hypothetical protein